MLYLQLRGNWLVMMVMDYGYGDGNGDVDGDDAGPEHWQ
jgi:hypothetical protein